jgi:hypothetical protein
MFKSLCVLVVLFASTAASTPAPVAATTCFGAGEYTNGTTKICYYDCYCGKKALNVQSWQLCPISAKFDC